MRKLNYLIYLILAVSLTGCASYDFSHRIIQQGNLIPETKIQQIKPGMSKEQVAITMGSSLLSPTFNNDRWDYAYTWRRGTGPMTIRHVSFHFRGGVVSRIEYKS